MNVKPPDDRRRPTLKDIADELGVAVSTVSNAYNRPDQLSPELRTKILATARRLGYVGPDPTARSLRRGVSHTIGLLYPDPLSYAFTDPVAALFVQGIAREVECEGYTLLLVGGGIDGQRSAGRRARAGRAGTDPVTTASVDGLIVHCFADGDPLLHAAVERDLPMVMVDNTGIAGHPHVAVDDAGGARAAAEHLLALGHRRFGIASLEIGGEAPAGLVATPQPEQAHYRPTRARLQGYRDALEEAGLSWQRDAIVYECSASTPAEGRAAAAALLATASPPSALLAMSDQLALGALAFAREQKLDVPGDLSVIGFDDTPAAAQSDPALTTVRQPHIDKGRQAGRLLIRRLRGETAPDSVTLPTTLQVRASTGPPPTRGRTRRGDPDDGAGTEAA